MHTEPPSPPADRLRRLLCLFGYHRPERLERVAGSTELELVVCESCGQRRMRYKVEPPDDDWAPTRR